jgi:hypothetical protein
MYSVALIEGSLALFKRCVIMKGPMARQPYVRLDTTHQRGQLRDQHCSASIVIG